MNKENQNQVTDFGFQKVGLEIKQNLVNQVFNSVAAQYDIMNDLMSLGIHRLWKEEFCRQVPNLNSKILDVAGGTGDICFRLLQRAKLRKQTPHITLCDINSKMLKVALDKAINNNILHNIDYVCANGEELPFASNSFDYYTIAFGARNVKSVDKLLQEALRVLKPAGKFLCLEFSKIEPYHLEKLYQFYSFSIIPKIGKLITGDQEAYRYLVESIALFPEQERFKVMIEDAGFRKVSYKNLTFGVVAIHSAYKL